jgi:hypothetical protein
MMPGIQWIPVMLLLTGVGLLTGFTAVVLRLLAPTAVAGRRLGISAIAIGFLSPLFFLMVVGDELIPLAYLIIASPAVPGGLALMIDSSITE